MISINLLPHTERRGVSPALKLKLGLVLADIVLLLVTGVLIVAFVVADQAKKREIAKTQAAIDRLEPDVQEVKNLRVQLSELNTKQDIINRLVKNRLDWARKLHQLAVITQPQPIWLERAQLRTAVTRAKITPPKVTPKPAGAGAAPARPTPRPTPGPTERVTTSYFLILAGATHVPEAERGQRVADYMASLRDSAEFAKDFVPDSLTLNHIGQEAWTSKGEDSPMVMRFELELEFKLKQVNEIFGKPAAGPQP